MPRIFDNIEEQLLPALQETLQVADHADFCVGYFNLRGWKKLDSYIEKWSGGPGKCCRLLIGMQKLPQELLISFLGVKPNPESMDKQTVVRLKKKLAEEFREQLAAGVPTNEDEAGLRRLAAQIRAKKVQVKLFLRHQLHAKLYLLFRSDPINPAVGYLGSSNLTLAGLANQGELNVDVMDRDACQKLAAWFEARWSDHWCIDISDELADIIENSWAREALIPPYHIYIKIAYHLAQEARAGLSEFRIPKELANTLFGFQEAAVKIAAHHINKRGGVLIGDVVGLGKTLMATAVVRILEEDSDLLRTLIICPKNLVPMWEDYRYRYGMKAHIISITEVQNRMPELKRYHLAVIDESHNLRNQGKRFNAIREYIKENATKCILLSATPYNKTYIDLSNQLRLFIDDDQNLGIRPEHLLKEIGETEFIKQHQCAANSLSGFDKSPYADDWRELMRLYLVRRTRSFIKDNYAQTDTQTGRKYLIFPNGKRSYFPDRIPKTVKFDIVEDRKTDPYAKLYSRSVEDTINSLKLPRYGLGNYIIPTPHDPPTQDEAKILQNLSRAGKRLMGFCRTNLFKRLESSGKSFLLSIQRHILRNHVFLYAIENDKELPVGSQDSDLLDARIDDGSGKLFKEIANLRSEEEFKTRAATVYADYKQSHESNFEWLRPSLFVKALNDDLVKDVAALMKVFEKCSDWNPAEDIKLGALEELLKKIHPKEKVLVFTQFADTVEYLTLQLKARGITAIEGVTGDSENPTKLAWQFSPVSNDKRYSVSPEAELNVLIATDVLSEGQNLQDCHIVVNYDLPWAIIRLVQRAGRVDRIGQHSEKILCYSFLPADGVERIIRLRQRVRQRLVENAEVVGTDENFFEDDRNDKAIIDLYNEKAGIFDGDDGAEVDLSSYAWQIWKNAIDKDPSLQKIIPALPGVVFSTKAHQPKENDPEGILVYLKTAEGNDAMARIGKDGASITESQYAILKAAECSPDTPAMPHHSLHHDLVKKGVELIVEEERSVGGQLGNKRGARFRAYERLKRFVEDTKGTFFDTPQLRKAVDALYRFPLKQTAIDTLNRHLKEGADDAHLADLVVDLWEDERLCAIHEEEEKNEPKVICSMGLFQQ